MAVWIAMIVGIVATNAALSIVFDYPVANPDKGRISVFGFLVVWAAIPAWLISNAEND